MLPAKYSKRTLVYLAIGFIVAGLIAGAVPYFSQSREGVYPYNSTTDRSFILDVFKKNWYWLITDFNQNFSVENMLDKRASSEEPGHEGELTIVTYRVHNKPVGFVAYFMRELLEGFILYLAVAQEYRGKGYSRKLLTYAMDDLKKHGARIIRLQTRVDNKQARSLYSSFGFKQYWTDGAYLLMEKSIN